MLWLMASGMMKLNKLTVSSIEGNAASRQEIIYVNLGYIVENHSQLFDLSICFLLAKEEKDLRTYLFNFVFGLIQYQCLAAH